MMEGDGGGGDFGGDWGDGGALAGGALVGGGLIFGGLGVGAQSNLVPATPANLRKELTDLKQMLADGLITPEDYDVLKARALGL